MLRRILSVLGCGVLLAALALGSSGVKAADKASLTVSAGLFDLTTHHDQEFEGRLEYRFGHGFFESDGSFRGLKPLVGIMGNTAHAIFGYAGFAAPFAFDDGRWEFVPAAGIGAYEPGDGIFLGGTFEFHLGLSASYAVTPESRLGLAVNHISNANTHRKNPGVNSVLATWSLALDGP